MTGERAGLVVIYVVLGMWVFNILADIFNVNQWEADAQIHAIFSGVITTAWVLRNREQAMHNRQRRDKERRDAHEDESDGD